MLFAGFAEVAFAAICGTLTARPASAAMLRPKRAEVVATADAAAQRRDHVTHRTRRGKTGRRRHPETLGQRQDLHPVCFLLPRPGTHTCIRKSPSRRTVQAQRKAHTGRRMRARTVSSPTEARATPSTPPDRQARAVKRQRQAYAFDGPFRSFSSSSSWSILRWRQASSARRSLTARSHASM